MDIVLNLYLKVIILFVMMVLSFQLIWKLGMLYFILHNVAKTFDITFRYFNFNKVFYVFLACFGYDIFVVSINFCGMLHIFTIEFLLLWYFCYKNFEIFRINFDTCFNKDTRHGDNDRGDLYVACIGIYLIRILELNLRFY